MKPAPSSQPLLTVSNRQRSIEIATAHLRGVARAVLPHCLQQRGGGETHLGALDAVDISLVSDRAISALHVRFMNVPGATDVITFPHGEIVISAATAKRQAGEFGQDFHQELFRYIVHGLLHLNGHDDTTRELAAEMWRAQETLVAEFWRPCPLEPDRERASRKRKASSRANTR